MLLPFIANNQSGSTGIINEVIPFDEYAYNIAYSVNFSSTTPSDDFYCKAPEFLEAQLPFWIKQNYTNSEESYLIIFLKAYYNWLYCGFKNETYQLTPYDLEILFDIDQVPEGFIEHYINTYAPFIKIETPNLKKENLRSFLNNIKTNFLSSKGTKGSYEYLLNTLFGITLENILYPKNGILRLNGGRISEFYGTVLGSDTPAPYINYYNPNIINSFPEFYQPALQGQLPILYYNGLNSGVLQDDIFWNDYSYILQTSLNDSEENIYYANTVLKSVHPAGTKAFFEQYIPATSIDFGDIDDNTDSAVPPPNITELPIIRNYLLYYPNYSFSSAGITFCNCCTSYCDPTGITSYFPVHAEPRWSTSILDSIQTFGEITIGDFIELLPKENSPNPDTTDCTLCGA